MGFLFSGKSLNYAFSYARGLFNSTTEYLFFGLLLSLDTDLLGYEIFLADKGLGLVIFYLDLERESIFKFLSSS